jgi:hypothetical protein
MTNKAIKKIEVTIDATLGDLNINPIQGDVSLTDLSFAIYAMIQLGEQQKPGFKDQVLKLLVVDHWSTKMEKGENKNEQQ